MMYLSVKQALKALSRKSELDFLDVVPSSLDLFGAEIEMVNLVEREKRLKKSVDKLDGKYDFIIIDCPPSLGLLTLNALNLRRFGTYPDPMRVLCSRGIKPVD